MTNPNSTPDHSSHGRQDEGAQFEFEDGVTEGYEEAASSIESQGYTTEDYIYMFVS